MKTYILTGYNGKRVRHPMATFRTAELLVRATAWTFLFCAFFVASSEIASAQAMSGMKPASFTSIVRSNTTPGAIDVTGRADPRNTVNLELDSDEEGVVFRAQAQANESGEWQVTIGDSSVPEGAYTLRAIVQDEKGVLGPLTEVRGYKVKPPPLLKVGQLDFGWVDAFLVLLFLSFFGIAFGSWYHEHHKRRQEEHALSTERDITAMSASLLNEVDRLDHLIRESKSLDPHVVAEAEYILKNQHATVGKIQGYLSARAERTGV